MVSDRERLKLRGPVREVRRRVVLRERNGHAVEKPQSSSLLRFDEAGRLVAQGDGSGEWPACPSTASYDAAGRLQERVWRDAEGVVRSRLVLSYDTAGRVVEQRSFGVDGSLSKSQRSIYGARGGRIDEEEWHFSVEPSDGGGPCLFLVGGDDGGSDEASDSELPVGLELAPDSRRLRKVFDSEGRLREVAAIDSHGRRFSRLFYSYDLAGRLVRLESHSLRSGLSMHWAGKFGGRLRRWLKPLLNSLALQILRLYVLGGLLARGEMRRAARSLVRGPLVKETTYLYDAAGRRSEERILIMSRFLTRSTSTYDEQGNLAEEILLGPEDVVHMRRSFQREYDEHGNWTRQIETDGLPGGSGSEDRTRSVVVTERELTYG